ncbi:MAG: class I SAM-dependent methyltransferase family protein [Candidatus Bathyarchaeota archaeon]|nr:class I SAM-dependent methyltransferase family protein [Candidatus Bathyarchaeota archaeon]MDW8040217.1 class I SAM-dependent methyltransferase family protein [Nitrososphaerota archaeon]
MRKRLKKLLAAVLPSEELTAVYNSYDVIGDITVIRLNEAFMKHGQIIAETIMKVHKNVKTVLAQVGPVQGDFRLRKLEHLAGENKTKTVHRESNCVFAVDLSHCYFSPRLFYERMRIAKLVKDGETIVNMFAGVGCFSIIIAKHSNAAKIYSIDINPAAVQFMKENIRLNRVYGRVIPIEGDAKDVIQQRLRNVADRVLMPLPEKALQYLPYAFSALKNGAGWIHIYAFEHANRREKPVEKTMTKVSYNLEKLGVNFEIPFGRIVRTTGPNWYQIVLDILCKGLKS